MSLHEWEAQEGGLAVFEVQLLILLDNLLGKGTFVFWQNFMSIM